MKGGFVVGWRTSSRVAALDGSGSRFVGFLARRRTLACGVVVAVALGCAKDEAPKIERPPVEDALLWIRQAYVMTHTAAGPPTDEETLRAGLAIVLKDRQVEHLTVDDALISPRDGKPFVIRMGTKTETTGSHTLLAYEQDGVDGKRYVLTAGLEIRKIGQAEFERDLAGQGPKPPPPGP